MNCYGNGLQPSGVVQGKPAEFTIDTKKAGAAPLDVKVKLATDMIYYYTLSACKNLFVKNNRINGIRLIDLIR